MYGLWMGVYNPPLCTASLSAKFCLCVISSLI